jgi:DNA-directed RNA polymerase subunit omega
MRRTAGLLGLSAVTTKSILLDSPPGADDLMIEALKSDEIVNKMGGRFKLTALIQRRLKELIIDGARPLVERDGRTDLEVVIEEILQDKIVPDWSDGKPDTVTTG